MKTKPEADLAENAVKTAVMEDFRVELKRRAIIPAAGKGTRLHTGQEGLPKVMHKVCGRTLLEVVLEQTSFIAPEETWIVVGYQKEQVMSHFGSNYHYTEQKEQLGTGHAVLVCAEEFRDFDGTVLVTFGDMPLFRREVMEAMCEAHEQSHAACTLLTAKNPDLVHWARITRTPEGAFSAIVEAKDCTSEQLQIEELFAGVFVFDSKALFQMLPLVGTNNVQHEYYLTEVPQLMASRGMKVETYFDDDGDDLRGVNTAEDLVVCEEILRKRQEGGKEL